MDISTAAQKKDRQKIVSNLNQAILEILSKSEQNIMQKIF